MTNRNKQRGTAFETQLVNYLKDNGFPDVYRPALTGAGDIGDVVGIKAPQEFRQHPRYTIIQAKNQKTFALSGWLNDTVQQAANKGPGTIPLLAVKRTGIGPANLGKTYVVMQLDDALRLLGEAGYS